LVLDREFETQSADPMALEPESGLAWYDTGRKDLNLVIGVQSPSEITTAIAYLLGNAQAAFKPAHISANCASCGGGFGGRDHTPFPLYVALAGMFFPNRPVRLANNRFEQFQLGIKRHAFKMRTQIGVDRATGKIVGFAADHVLDGGGLANFSGQVASVGALAALGIYYAPKVDLTTYAFHSRGVTAGSMRCYGTIQPMTALEVQVDEICTALPLDPIEFRRRNATRSRQPVGGNAYVVSIRTPEILDKLEKHPIWAQRAEEKARGQQGEFSSALASRSPPRTTAPAVTLAWHPSRSGPTAGLPFIATALRWATVSERRWPIGSRGIWAVSRTKSRSSKSTHLVRSIS
jgi:CO/xanthine dehydrogenase Mo-binding subunit